MDPSPITHFNIPLARGDLFTGRTRPEGISFQAFLDREDPVAPTPAGLAGPAGEVISAGSGIPVTASSSSSNRAAAAAYRRQEAADTGPARMSDIQKYKDDQLLSNPGGDHYYLDQKRVDPDSPEQKSFWGRIGKDVSDAVGNLKNFVGDFLFGSKIRYRDENGRIQEAERKGLVGSVVDFFKDVGSAISFGAWRPDGEQEPEGFMNRVGFFFSKMKEALFGDLVQGVSGSVVHMGEDLLFAGWNLLEIVPDATIGNFEAGRKLTTAVFDNGQVVLDYLTDILPAGDAWVRVHSPDLKTFKPPVLHNLAMPETGSSDERWRYVRNTPFRKAIETMGSFLTDILTFKFLGQVRLFGEERHQRN